MKVSTEKKNLKKAEKLLTKANKEAKKNGLQDMSLDEINAEIKAYRQERNGTLAIAEGKQRMNIFAVIDTNVLVSALIKKFQSWKNSSEHISQNYKASLQ